MTDAFTRPRAFAALILAAGLALPAAAWATAPSAAPEDPLDEGLSTSQRLSALIERVKLEQSRMKTLEARFVQLRESDLLLQPEESRGLFSYAAPDRVRWEYESPNPISVLIDGQEMTTWYRDLGRADKLEIGRYSAQVFKYLGASGSMETLVDYFRVNVTFPSGDGEPFRLRLLPKYEKISKRVESMVVWIDGERYLPTRLLYVSPAGDTTDIRFEDLRVNAEIPGDRFVLDLPSDVTTRTVDLGESAD